MATDARFCASCGAAALGGSADPAQAAGPGAARRERPGLVTAIAGFVACWIPVYLLLAVTLVLGLAAEPALAGLGLFYALLGGLHVVCAIGLLKLKRYGRTTLLGLSLLYLLGFPIGTVLSILILIYMTRPEMKLLFSETPVERMSEADVAILARAGSGAATAPVVIVAAMAASLLFLAIIGVVAAIAIPNFLNALDRGKQKRTMADLRTLGTAMEEFAIENGRYPGPTDGWVPVTALEDALIPVYIQEITVMDAWEHPILVRSTGEDYILVSPGKDGVRQSAWEGGGPTRNFDCDIIFAQGSFVQWPEGTQSD